MNRRLMHLIACAAAISLACESSAQSSGRFNIRVYHDTTFPTSIEDPHFNACLMNEEDESEVRVFFSIYLDEPLQSNEILLVLGELQARQDADATYGTGTAGLNTGIFLGTSPTDFDSGETNRYEITERNGQNLAQAQGLRWESHTKMGTFKPLQNWNQLDENESNLRRYVNFYGKLNHEFRKVCIQANDATAQRSKLTIVRFTPVEAPRHGWFVDGLFEATSNAMTIPNGSQTNAKVAYVADMETPLRGGDIIIALSEAQVDYTGTDQIRFKSELRLSETSSTQNSDYEDDPPIAACNEFSMKSPVRTKRTAVKVAAYQVPGSSMTTTDHRYLKYVAWYGSGTPLLPDEPEDPVPDEGTPGDLIINADDEELQLVGTDMGKLSVLRFRQAQEGDRPVGIQRYDQPEYNAALPSPQPPPHAKMERLCGLPGMELDVLFTQKIENLQVGEILLAGSEMEATNQIEGTRKDLRSRIKLGNTDSATSSSDEIAKFNHTQIGKNNTHHGMSPKVGMIKIASSQTGTKYVNRVIRVETALGGSQSTGFTEYCDNDNCDPDDNCQMCFEQGPCNVLVTCSKCDVIHHNFGRLAVLRFTPGDALFCLSDIAPTGGNGVVNVDDLVILLQQWGPCTASGCLADINDDGLVNVDDLVFLLGAWGNCSGQGGISGPPQNISDCWNIHCVGLTGEDWSNCLEKCFSAVCAAHPEQCD